MLLSRARKRAVGIFIGCLGLVLTVPYLIVEILEAYSPATFLQHFIQPSRIFHHIMMLLAIPAFILIGYFYEKQKNLAENLEQRVKERAERLRESQEKLRAQYKGIPIPTYTWQRVGEDFVLVNYNDAAEAITHGKVANYVGKKASEMYRDRPKILEELSRCFAEKTTIKREMLYRFMSTGESKYLAVSYAFVPPDLVLVHTEDITERKQMQKKLEEYSQHLEKLVEKRTRELRKAQEHLLKSERLAAIGKVATMVGHDLRNPLQSIENATYYLNSELPRLALSAPISQKTIEMLQVINDSVNYADRIIRDLQDFSATKKPIFKKTDVNAIVKETLSQVEAPKNVEFITELGNLPEVEVDKDMIKRVFLNLAINGLQAMENGGTLKVSTKKTKGFVEVSFRDTGIGIPKENIKKIFIPFFTTKAQGMGMGLAICKKFVDAHGGDIKVESEEGKGSTFTVKLPIKQENGGVKNQ
jgi:signal transduction histidine kinase